MYGYESWTIKTAEHQKINSFELRCWRRLLGVPWTARRSNQSILKKISPEYSLEGLMPKMKLQYFWPPDAKNWLIWKDPGAGKDWRQEEKGMTEDEMVGWHHQLNGLEFEQTLGVGDGQGSLVCCYPLGDRVGHNWATELNWIDSFNSSEGEYVEHCFGARTILVSRCPKIYPWIKQKHWSPEYLEQNCIDSYRISTNFSWINVTL